MRKFHVTRVYFGNGRFVSAEIKDSKDEFRFTQVMLFLPMMRKDNINYYINDIKNYNFPKDEFGGYEDCNLLNDYAIRGLDERTGMLEFVNYNIDEDIDVISKDDLLDIIEQWKEILIKEKG